MATLTSPVSPQNIVDRFADYVVGTGNLSISWGTNAQPPYGFPVWPFGGDTNGKPLEINGGSIAARGTPITAANIYNTLVAETNRYTRIRNLRALVYVAGGGGNTGNYGSPGYIWDGTAVANMNGNYLQNIGAPSANGVTAANVVTAAGLEAFFNTLRASYSAARGNTVTIQHDICHSSCHSACHSNRGRR